MHLRLRLGLRLGWLVAPPEPNTSGHWVRADAAFVQEHALPEGAPKLCGCVSQPSATEVITDFLVLFIQEKMGPRPIAAREEPSRDVINV